MNILKFFTDNLTNIYIIVGLVLLLAPLALMFKFKVYKNKNFWILSISIMTIGLASIFWGAKQEANRNRLTEEMQNKKDSLQLQTEIDIQQNRTQQIKDSLTKNSLQIYVNKQKQNFFENPLSLPSIKVILELKRFNFKDTLYLPEDMKVDQFIKETTQQFEINKRMDSIKTGNSDWKIRVNDVKSIEKEEKYKSFKDLKIKNYDKLNLTKVQEEDVKNKDKVPNINTDSTKRKK